MVGRIERLRLRDVWKHEAQDFTPWMEDNIDVLSEILDINLVSAEREKDAGTFSVDLVAEDENGDMVVIENQLEKSDHDHLGKLLTYLTSIGASAAIWVVADPRPEHVQAIAWLNESSSANFYLVKLEAIRIGESEPAPLFTLIVGPSVEAKRVGETKKNIAERHTLRHEFWSQLLDYARTKTKLHANNSPSPSNWIGAGAGKSGIGYHYYIKKNEGGVELHIDRGPGSEEENTAIFNELRQHKEEIEQVFGDSLEWNNVEGTQRSRINKEFNIGGWKSDPEEWPKINEVMVDAMIRLERALSPFVQKLNI
jgi:hypothetical protein